MFFIKQYFDAKYCIDTSLVNSYDCLSSWKSALFCIWFIENNTPLNCTEIEVWALEIIYAKCANDFLLVRYYKLQNELVFNNDFFSFYRMSEVDKSLGDFLTQICNSCHFVAYEFNLKSRNWNASLMSAFKMKYVTLPQMNFVCYYFMIAIQYSTCMWYQYYTFYTPKFVKSKKILDEIYIYCLIKKFETPFLKLLF